MSDPPGRSGLRILDLAAIVVGYSLAALGLRAFWPASVEPSLGLGLVLALVFGWLGLAMSGPFILLLEARRRAVRPRDPGDPDAPRPVRPTGYTAAETAWILIGGYWIAVTIILVPSRLPSRTTPLLGAMPVIAAVLFWAIAPRSPSATSPARQPWTHRVALAVLASWPLAWCGLILLTSALS